MSHFVEVFAFELPFWEPVLRGTVIYWFLLLVFRYVLRRDVGSMGIADLLFVVLVADAASNAMQGEYKSVGDGLVLVGTLVAWNFAIDWTSYRYAWIARLLESQPEILVKHGRLRRKALQREMISKEELMGKLRQAGVQELSEVRVAYLESDGQLSVFRRDGQPADTASKGGDGPPGGG